MAVKGGSLGRMSGSERVRASNSSDISDDCAPEHESKHLTSKPRLAGTVCSFEHARATGDAEVARIAGLQHECIHRIQLVAAGIGRGGIVRRLASQQIHTLHRDVYGLGRPSRDRFTLAMAAVLRFKGDALLSDGFAAAVWGFTDEEPDLVEVTLVGRSCHPLPGVRVHRVATLDRDDTAWRRDLPVTSPARTLVDLAGALDVIELESALAICRARKLATDREILAAIERAPHKAGVGTLRRLLESGGLSETRSRYERRLLKLIRDAGLPRPVVNVKVEGHMVDLFWPEQRLVVEFDGFKFHGDRRAFETDRLRDQRLVAAGYRVIRITARQLDHDSYAVIARLAAALAEKH